MKLREPLELPAQTTPGPNEALTRGWAQDNLGGGSDTRYVHVEATPIATWTINHNLGKRPTVTVVSGGKVVMGEVNYTDENTLTVAFSEAISGSAYLN